MRDSYLVIGLAVLITKLANIESQVIEIAPNGTIYALEGEGLNISCYSDGSTNGTLKWFNRSLEIIEDENNRIYSVKYHTWDYEQHKLVFNPILLTDFGTYRCCGISISRLQCEQVTVYVTEEDSTHSQTQITGYPPRFRIDFASYEFVEGDDAYLECYAYGRPTPEYMWLDAHGSKMDNYTGNWDVSSKGWLKIYSIKSSQEGTYTCVAMNYYGNSSKLYLVNVSRGRSPWFRQIYEYYEVNTGSDVVLECQAEGIPKSTYEWYDKYGRNMRYVGGNWNASTDGLLEIYSIEKQQAGNYSCVASNEYGNASKQYEIEVKDDFKLNATVEEKWQTLVRFSINIEGGNITYEYVLLKYRSYNSRSYNWNKVIWSFGDTYVLSGLTPGDTYDFIFGVKERRYTEEYWVEKSRLTLRLKPFAPQLIVNEMKKGMVKIGFPSQSLDETIGRLKPLYFNLRYVRLRQISASFYEEDCAMSIRVPPCLGRTYLIGGLSSGYYYKIELSSMLKSGSSEKNEIIVLVL